MEKKWNISILVIFVLLASSLLGVLSMNFVQQMMRQSAVVHSYYSSYYLAKAGVELGLAQIVNRGVGFERVVGSGDAVMSGNFLCGDRCALSVSISGTSTMLSKAFRQGSGCTSPYVLSGGDSVIIPLFRDVTPWTVADMFASWVVYENLAQIFKNDWISFDTEFGGDVNFGILILSGDDLSENGIFFQKWNLKSWLTAFREAFEQYLWTIDSGLYPLDAQLKNNYDKSRLVDNGYKMYLLISNTSSAEEQFCASVVQPQQAPTVYVLPTDSFFVSSQASYGNQYVALDASYAQPIPGFLFSTYSSF